MTQTGTTRIRYYGIVEGENGRLSEVLVIRENGRQVSQTLTGRTFPTMRAAMRANESKNARFARRCAEPPTPSPVGRAQ